MRTRTFGTTSFRGHSDLLKYCTAASTVGLMWIAGCSSDTDAVVTPDGATGGVAAGGSTGDLAAGGSTGGAPADETNPNSGGNTQADNSQSIAGEAAMTQGGTGQGGTSAIAGASGLVGGATATAPCPAYNAAGGVLITPPSNDFESDITEWTTMTGNSSALSLKQSAASACLGSSYLACDGATRSGAWDGPKLMILPYVVVGHQYVATLAARFDPDNAPVAAGTIKLSTVNACVDSTIATAFRNLEQATTSSDWVRLSGTVEPVLAGCEELSEVTVYVETDADNQAYSIDIDDFQLWDVTP
jgi:hypothetical protein